MKSQAFLSKLNLPTVRQGSLTSLCQHVCGRCRRAGYRAPFRLSTFDPAGLFGPERPPCPFWQFRALRARKSISCLEGRILGSGMALGNWRMRASEVAWWPTALRLPLSSVSTNYLVGDSKSSSTQRGLPPKRDCNQTALAHRPPDGCAQTAKVGKGFPNPKSVFGPRGPFGPKGPQSPKGLPDLKEGRSRVVCAWPAAGVRAQA